MSLEISPPLPNFSQRLKNFLRWRDHWRPVAFSRTRRAIGNAGDAIPRAEATDSNTFAGFIRHQQQRRRRRWRWVALERVGEKYSRGSPRGTHARREAFGVPRHGACPYTPASAYLSVALAW